ncbi:polyphosphate polymerase domain-containing protein [Planktomarina temperata]|nr:polyphosphate polymerase domain-containing protein [Planktomarina temperata]
MSFRKENKYRISSSEVFQLQAQLSKLGMYEIYSKRLISSCYFDTHNFTLFHESEEGTLPRKKVRVRWYNGIMNLRKEQKISSMEGRFKTIKNITTIQTESDLQKITYFDQTYGWLTPKIIISYYRQYFRLNALRITFDQKISYQPVLPNVSRKAQDQECVMEVKAPVSTDDGYIEKYISLPTSRFSKYGRGLQLLSLQDKY